METDEQRWLNKIQQHEPKEVGRAQVETQNGVLVVKRVEVAGSPEFVLEFGDPMVEVKLLPAQTYRLVQLLIALADLAPAGKSG